MTEFQDFDEKLFNQFDPNKHGIIQDFLFGNEVSRSDIEERYFKLLAVKYKYLTDKYIKNLQSSLLLCTKILGNCLYFDESLEKRKIVLELMDKNLNGFIKARKVEESEKEKKE